MASFCSITAIYFGVHFWSGHGVNLHSMQRAPFLKARAYASQDESLLNWSPIKYLQHTQVHHMCQVISSHCI